MSNDSDAHALIQLKKHIEDAVARYCQHEEIRGAVTKVLSRPGFALHPDSPCRPGVFALTIHESIRRDNAKAAFLAAAATELYVEAGFLFDHVADDELDPEYGNTPAEELALAIAVMNVGAGVACAAARASDATTELYSRLEHFFIDMVTACTGQYLDAHFERGDPVSTDDAHLMTALKGGGYGRQVAALAASTATTDPDVIEQFGDLGFELLTYMQLIDDITDACPPDSEPHDFLQFKKTVPLSFFCGSVDEHLLPPRSGIIQHERENDDESFRSAYLRSGATEFGSVVAEAHLNRAKEILAELEERLGPLVDLKRHVETLESSPQEIHSSS